MIRQTQQSPGSPWGSRPCSGSRNRDPSRRSEPSRLCRRSGRTTGSSPSCCSDLQAPSLSGSSGGQAYQKIYFPPQNISLLFLLCFSSPQQKIYFLLQIFSFFFFSFAKRYIFFSKYLPPFSSLLQKKHIFFLQIFNCWAFLCLPEMSTVVEDPLHRKDRKM